MSTKRSTFVSHEIETHAELMRHARSQALRRVHIGAKHLKIDEEIRWQIAGEVVVKAAARTKEIPPELIEINPYPRT